MTHKTTLVLAGLLGALAVGLGAFGAHALKPMLLETSRLDTYQTAVQYHFYHVLALLATSILWERNANTLWRWAAIAFAAGILLFSGSLYLICFTGVTKLGIVTPFGGVFFIAGWVVLAVAGLKKQ